MNPRRYCRSMSEAFPALRAGCVEHPDGTITGYYEEYRMNTIYLSAWRRRLPGWINRLIHRWQLRRDAAKHDPCVF